LGGTPAGGPFLTDREHPEYKVLGQLNPPVRVFTIMRNRVHDGVLSVHDQRNTQLGLGAHRAWKSSVNGRGPWWNAGASHMTHAVPPKLLARMGLISLVDLHQRLQLST